MSRNIRFRWIIFKMPSILIGWACCHALQVQPVPFCQIGHFRPPEDHMMLTLRQHAVCFLNKE